MNYTVRSLAIVSLTLFVAGCGATAPSGAAPPGPTSGATMQSTMDPNMSGGQMQPTVAPAPQATTASAPEVTTPAGSAQTPVDDSTAAPGATEVSPATAIADVRVRLTKAVDQYKAQQTDQAYETAAAAYTEGFEQVEGPLGQKDQAFVSASEAQFKEFRDAIKAGRPVADVEQIVQQINRSLDKALTLLQ